MLKMTPHQTSIRHFALAIAEWRAKGWSDSSVTRMLRQAMEHMAVHKAPAADITICFEIANGVRCA